MQLLEDNTEDLNGLEHNIDGLDMTQWQSLVS